MKESRTLMRRPIWPGFDLFCGKIDFTRGVSSFYFGHSPILKKGLNLCVFLEGNAFNV